MDASVLEGLKGLTEEEVGKAGRDWYEEHYGQPRPKPKPEHPWRRRLIWVAIFIAAWLAVGAFRIATSDYPSYYHMQPIEGPPMVLPE